MTTAIERSPGMMKASGRAGSRRGVGVLLMGALLLAAVFVVVSAGSAFAASQWRADVDANSTAAPGGSIAYHLQMANVGEDPADGSGGDPIVFRVALAPQVSATGIEIIFPPFGTFDPTAFGWVCSGDGPGPAPGIVGAHNLGCTIVGVVDPHGLSAPPLPLKPVITTDVAGDASGTLESEFTVSGAGAGAVTTHEATRITTDPSAFGVSAFDGAVTDAAGLAYTQAGGHPYEASTTIEFNTETNANSQIGDLWPVAAPKTLEVDLPAGFVGYPTAADRCEGGELIANDCPPTAQVGSVLLHLNGVTSTDVLGPVPVYNLVPPPNMPAQFGFNIYGVVSTLGARVRSDSDYGITIMAPNLPEGLAFASTTLTLWGFPSDEVHRPERACRGGVYPHLVANHGPTCASGAARLPFLRNPTSCPEAGRGLATSLRVDSWEEPGRFVTASFRTHESPGYPRAPQNWGPEVGPTNCRDVPFDPAIGVSPVEPARAGTPTGFSFDVSIPQPQEAGGTSQSDLKTAVVRLPEGVRVSPASAAGLGGCSSADIKLHTLEEPTCPDASKIGQVSLETPLLDEPLQGSVYLATPFDNPARKLVGLYIVVRGHGVLIKLPGEVDVDQVIDPSTGERHEQLTTTFDNNPQAPFSNLQLRFNDGPKAPLTTPDACGTYTTHATFTGWSGAIAQAESSFTLAQDADGNPCKAGGFNPSIAAGTENPVAGKTTPLRLRITRPEQNQQISGITVNMPPGLSGYVSRADLCSETNAANGTCTGGSQIGNVTVGAGAGANPFYITNGRAYLTGPYKKAPYGLSIVVPAVAGPFDLGTVNVRSALFVDKHDATLRVLSDPLPTDLQGISLDVRDVRVSIDKPRFIVNPTSCAVKRIDGTIVSSGGLAKPVSTRFQVGECASLGFRPRMAMRVGGRGHTRRSQTSPFTTTLTMPQRNQANLRFVRVTLPKTINARLNTINDACTRAEFESDVTKCAHAKAGTATATTPLLRGSLNGNVYFVKNGNPIPDLFVALRGQVSFDLIGKFSIVNNTLLRTTFATAPDVPIRSFTLRLLGGPRTASIGAVANLCSPTSRQQKAQVDYIAQSGKVLQVAQALTVTGCGARQGRTRKR